MPSNPISGRQARAQLEIVKLHVERIDKVAGAYLAAHDEILKRGLLGRLRWLILGR